MLRAVYGGQLWVLRAVYESFFRFPPAVGGGGETYSVCTCYNGRRHVGSNVVHSPSRTFLPLHRLTIEHF